MTNQPRHIAALAVAACLLPVTLSGASLEFTPNRLAMGQGQAATIELHNHGAATVVQVRAYAWAQRGDSDELTPTNEIIVSPPIFNVPEQDVQVVRLLNRSTVGGDGERFYRLLIDEVPSPQTDRRQVVFALRASVPVFVGNQATTAEALEWHAERGAGGVLLSVSNVGRRSARISEVVVSLPGGGSASAKPAGKNPYVLPGAQRHWALPQTVALPAGTVLRLRVATEAGTKQESVVIR